MTVGGERPILWQLELSHYNEKVRWALDHKRIPHVRRALLPGVHTVVARRLTGARALLRVMFGPLRVAMRHAFRIDGDTALRSRARTIAAMDRLERELGPAGYLVGDRFTVADLTAASLFYPIVRPPSFPYPSITAVPPDAQAFLDSLAGRPGGRWVTRMYERHRAAR